MYLGGLELSLCVESDVKELNKTFFYTLLAKTINVNGFG